MMSRMAAHGCSRLETVDDQAVAPEPARRAKHHSHRQEGGMTAFHSHVMCPLNVRGCCRANIYRNYRKL